MLALTPHASSLVCVSRSSCEQLPAISWLVVPPWCSQMAISAYLGSLGLKSTHDKVMTKSFVTCRRQHVPMPHMHERQPGLGLHA